FAAATRAVGALQQQIEAELAASKGSTATAPTSKTSARAKPDEAKPATSKPAVAKAASGGDRAATPGSKTTRADKTTAADSTSPPPLLELKGSALSTDIEHLGERLLIFNDRVELRDR